MCNASIITNKLTIGYRPVTNSSQPVVVQKDLSFTLRQGEMVCMLGPNGCGKSTLLRTLAGLQPALGGEFELTNPERKGSESAKSIALVLTERLSMENTTVHDIVAMGRYPYTSFLDGLKEEDEQIINEALEQVGFPEPQKGLSTTMFNAHSDGEKQRILIAKALAQQTPIVLLDEPTAHLDLPHRILILRLLRRLAHEQSKTFLISTHELDLALALSDRILLMTKGEGIQLDSAENLRKENAFTKAFGMDIFNALG